MSVQIFSRKWSGPARSGQAAPKERAGFGQWQSRDPPKTQTDETADEIIALGQRLTYEKSVYYLQQAAGVISATED